MKKPTSRLRRPRHPVPGFVRAALISRKLTEAYQARPPYQRNDYIGWIMRAKLPATKDKRLAQMLDELERGGVYMKMAYLPKRTLQDRSVQYGERPARRRDH
jgi:hypothetical protein